MNPERAVVGLATVFDEPDLTGEMWHPWQFEAFAASGLGVDMLLEHHAPLMPTDRALGTWRAFKVLPRDGARPAGLLALGYVDDHARGLLADIERDLDPYSGATPWGLSVTAVDASDAEDGSKMWVKEVSFTKRPAHRLARVTGVGQHALDRWELMVGSPPPPMTTATPRTVARRLLGATMNGTPIYDEGA